MLQTLISLCVCHGSYSPKCGYCSNLLELWEELALDEQTDFKVGVVNGPEYPTLCQQHEVKGFPTIKLYVACCVWQHNHGRWFVMSMVAAWQVSSW
jgi:hypothetical protein